MKILVTGGAGFIGSNLVKYINTVKTHSVVVLDDLSTGNLNNLKEAQCEFVEGNLLDFDLVENLVSSVDSVIHLGAIPSVPRSVKNPMASHHANTTGTLNVLEAARKHENQHVIVASSSSVYGSNPKLPKSESDWTRPLSPYAVSKLATESYAVAYGHAYGLSTLAFRFFNVYGPGQSAGHAYAAVVPQFLSAALKRIPLPVNGDGKQSRDFTYVGTVVETLLKAAERRVTSDSPVNLAYGTNTNLSELINIIETKLGYSLEIQYNEPRIGDVRASQADKTLLTRLFPDVFPISLEQGIEETISWFRTVDQ